MFPTTVIIFGNIVIFLFIIFHALFINEENTGVSPNFFILYLNRDEQSSAIPSPIMLFTRSALKTYCYSSVLKCSSGRGYGPCYVTAHLYI